MKTATNKKIRLTTLEKRYSNKLRRYRRLVTAYGRYTAATTKEFFSLVQTKWMLQNDKQWRLNHVRIHT